MAAACFQQGTIVAIEGIEYRISRKIADCWQLEQLKTGELSSIRSTTYCA
jgi:hypothetical protein